MSSMTTIALVTGANKGIGYHIVEQLAARGMTVLLGGRDQKRREAAAAELGVEPIALDVTDPATVAAAAARLEADFGRLDVLVNNAGIAGTGRPRPPSDTAVDAVHEVFDTNVYGVIRVTNAMLPLLLRSPAPRIVNVSSLVGSLAAQVDPAGRLSGLPPSVGYPVSKTALNAVTVQYARELAGRVLVNAADPGYCATDLNNHTGFRTAAEGAAIAVRLATLDADGPTGGFFNDDGPVAW
jgi:NAD(P)-dependent dehydrogenase (short-subunit alcohol dehydrogenase family)